MAGDTIQAAVRAFYRQQATSQNNAGVPAEDMAVSLMQALSLPPQAAASTHAANPQARLATPQAGLTSSDLDDLKSKDPLQQRTDKPKAYLNYVFFDNQFNFVEDGSGVKQVDSDPNELETLSSGQVVAKKTGYVYVYTSNESQQDVLFDNMGVTQITGPVLEETHYYPFGLTMAGISSQAFGRIESRRKYNGIEFNHKEFSDGTGLDLYTAKFRGLDPQIGRWWQIDPKSEKVISQSPYISMGNNPISNIDPLGNLFFGLFGSSSEQRRAAREVAEATNGEIHKLLSRKIHVDYSTRSSEFNFETGHSQSVFIKHSISFRKNGHIDYHDPVMNYVSDQSLAWQNSHYVDRNGNIHFKPAPGTAEYVPVESLLVPLPPVLRVLGRSAEVAEGEATVFRVFGGDTRAEGFSWTPKNPNSVNDFRNVAGLPSGGVSGFNNTAEFMIEGKVNVQNIISKRAALPLDGNMGGLPEYIIDPKNVSITNFSVLKP